MADQGTRARLGQDIGPYPWRPYWADLKGIAAQYNCPSQKLQSIPDLKLVALFWA
jgi:hypothetical protein